jgi:hypothetical protein
MQKGFDHRNKIIKTRTQQTLWTALGLASILTLGVEKGSILDDDRFSSIFVAISWAYWIFLGLCL